MPKEIAEKNENGDGRSDPNFFPTVPGPVGRFSFDICSPLQMIKDIIGPDMYRSCCCCLWSLICILITCLIGYYMIPVIMGNLIVG